MARDDERGELPSTRTQEWSDVRAALQRARLVASSASQSLRTLQQPAMRRHVLRPADPRLTTRPTTVQSRVRSQLSTHFCLQNPGPFDILNLADAYQRIYQRLMNLNRRSFRMVTDRVANGVAQSGGGDTFGYVRPQERDRIYLNEFHFSLGGGSSAPGSASTGPAVSRTGRSVVQAGGDGFHVQQSLPIRASIVLHETVHLVYGADGAVHRALRGGWRSTIGFQNCSTPYPQIRTLLQAMGDAYVWERFAHCVYDAP